MRDGRKAISKRVNPLPDGFLQIGDRDGISEYLFFGENSQYIVESIPMLSDSIESIISKASNLSVTFSSGSTFLSGVNGGSETIYVNNTKYFAYVEEYTTLPKTKEPPSGKIISERTQISQDGFTLTGDIIIVGTSKGLITTENYLDKDGLNIVQGTIDGDRIITSVSKSNPRYINGSLYYIYSISYQEI